MGVLPLLLGPRLLTKDTTQRPLGPRDGAEEGQEATRPTWDLVEPLWAPVVLSNMSALTEPPKQRQVERRRRAGVSGCSVTAPCGVMENQEKGVVVAWARQCDSSGQTQACVSPAGPL